MRRFPERSSLAPWSARARTGPTSTSPATHSQVASTCSGPVIPGRRSCTSPRLAGSSSALPRWLPELTAASTTATTRACSSSSSAAARLSSRSNAIRTARVARVTGGALGRTATVVAQARPAKAPAEPPRPALGSEVEAAPPRLPAMARARRRSPRASPRMPGPPPRMTRHPPARGGFRSGPSWAWRAAWRSWRSAWRGAGAVTRGSGHERT